ncbi:MAG: hypothetical protein PWQ18_1274 [Clostridia bacterium]|nr:hypothetical protein [Clostridia bacterium]
MRDSGDKRQHILAAATGVFASQGFYRAKIADIAAAAGVGKGTVYEYFRSKKDLFQQLLLHQLTVYLDYLQGVGLQEQTLEQFLNRLIKESLGYFQAHREIARILLSDHPPIDASIHDLLLAAQQEKLKRLQTYLQAAADRGEMRPVSPWLVAILVLGFISVLGRQMVYEEGEDFNAAATAAAMTDILLRGIGRK